MKQKEKFNWNNISYRQFQLLKSALDIEDELEKTVAMTQAIYGDDVIELPLAEFNELCKNLEFLKGEVPTTIKVKDVNVNGREYYFDGMLGKVSTALYLDFQNYMKADDEAKMFSVFFIPKGHKYNDGYDMLLVFEDIMDMPVTVLMSASFFFTRQLELFIKIFQRSSILKIKKLKISKEMKKNLEQILTNSANLASYHISSNFAK